MILGSLGLKNLLLFIEDKLFNKNSSTNTNSTPLFNQNSSFFSNFKKSNFLFKKIKSFFKRK
jgi:hypothetical protein